MVIDSSALIALLLGEPETADFVSAIAAASTRLVGELSVEIIPFTHDQAVIAIAAYRQYGKGSGHPAGLNFGDCFTYALAKLTGEPVLFKGNDFSRTDL